MSAGARYLHCAHCADEERIAVFVDTDGLHVVCETCEHEHAHIVDGTDVDILVQQIAGHRCAACGTRDHPEAAPAMTVAPVSRDVEGDRAVMVAELIESTYTLFPRFRRDDLLRLRVRVDDELRAR